jgi:hypothetical protein
MDEHLTTGIFADKESAEDAFNEAMNLGYEPGEINVLMSEDSRKKYYDSYLNPKPDESTQGLAVGGAVGGAIGSTIGALIALGTNLALPGLGLAIAGPLAGAGGVSGVLLGGLIGWGEKPSKKYEEELKEGKIILVVQEVPGRPSLQEAWGAYENTARYKEAR